MDHELPMVAESEATGRVRAVFADIRVAFPYVPMLFRAMAIQPVGLILAWEHAQALLRRQGIVEATINLERAGTPDRTLMTLPMKRLSRPRQTALRAILDHFAHTMPVHALIVTSLGLALGQEMAGDPVSLRTWGGEDIAPLEPDFDLVEPGDASAELRYRFRQIRAWTGLPYVEAFWRVLGADPILLEAVWRGLSQELDRDAFHRQEVIAIKAARQIATKIPPPQICSSAALVQAGIGDSLPAVQRLVGIMANGLLRHMTLAMVVARALDEVPLSA